MKYLQTRSEKGWQAAEVGPAGIEQKGRAIQQYTSASEGRTYAATKLSPKELKSLRAKRKSGVSVKALREECDLS